MVKKTVQHITEGNQIYWEEADVADADVNAKGEYTGKPLTGTAEEYKSKVKNGS